VNAKEILGPEDYATYRNVRAVAVLFVVFGSIFALAGVAIAFGEQPPPNEDQVPTWFEWVLTAIGLSGAAGGLAVLLGSRRWSKLAYAIAAFYTLGFPIGTIMGYTFLTGLPTYFDGRERLAKAAPDQPS